MTDSTVQNDLVLRNAITQHDVERARRSIDDGADLTTIDEEGMTPLMVAAKVGSPEIVELLLSAGADPDAKDNRGYTAEMIAKWYGEYRMGTYSDESIRIVKALRQHKR